jgi:predicted polyphosphate/ATP-dependent NAD kinase
VELVLFCGGDGTARNVFEMVGENVPILGIPAGVKMHSAVFGINPERCADILQEYLDGKIGVSEAEVMDLDEGLYRKGEWQLEIFGYARTPHEPAYVQAGKFMVTEVSDDEAKEDISRHVIEEMKKEPGALFVLGPGSTLEFIGNELGIKKTLLGIDVVMNGKMVEKDVNEKALLDLLDKNADASMRLVISPIGAQGFILGRGNHQLSPKVLNRVKVSDVWVVSTPAKLKRTPVLRIDTGDIAIDEKFTKTNYIFVITGYREKVMRRVER